ncbi:hypothetical protein [Nonomuraea rhodomycinica]|uniref:Integral membrane protein n=1 Tax=Nonomuraea rhodomycinica TaxID=1712872 RepID=A0A7Y6ISY1_9ACTN|nr:hypothetical protein [Nonomuraea rhodomycinica]NUW43837.1 hypothetical protein [Nonomuraea rhodomycinica]
MNARESEAAPEHVEYGGAVYGSLLAASVVAGSAAGTPSTAADLVALLISTGVVFWIAHVYVRLVEHGLHPMTWRRVRAAGRVEWPVAQAAFPPAAAAAIAWALGLSDAVATWVALGVAVASQVAWAVAAAVTAGSDRTGIMASAVINLVLGLIVVLLKTFVAGH